MTTSGSLALGIQLRSGLIQVGTALLVMAYLWMILTLSGEQWAELGWAVALVCVLSGLAWPFTQKPMMQPVLDAADAFDAGDESPEVVRAGLAGVSALPTKLFLTASTSWLLAALVVPIWMWLRLGSTPAGVLGVISAAALGGGLLSCIAAFFAVKRLVAPLRDHCASAIPDPDERAELVFHVPLALKLAVASSAIVLVSLFFMIQLAWTETAKPLEAHVVALEARYLAALTEAGGTGSHRRLDLQAAERELKALGIAEELIVLDPDAASGGSVGSLDERELAFVLAHGPIGDSRAIDSPRIFAWTTLGVDAGPIIVAVSSAAALPGGGLRSRLRYLGVLLVAVLASFIVSGLISSDVGRSLDRLGQRAAGVAAGDLRSGRAFESEDEMGSLGREVDRMIASLRETLDRVTRTAGHVDSAASAMAGIGESVNEASAAQALALDQGAREVASIDREIGGIKDSAHALTGNVEEASSSILELGAAGEELNHTASALTKQIESVSTSIEQMIISSRQIAENTEGLALEVAETSGSMGEMATSMDAVDQSANQTAVLSEQVSELAGRGRDRVRETIEGMDDIRDATDTVSDTIGGLDARIQEIGAIVDVIDDVADETNLLALNAAIIAAQAGDQGRAFSVVADEIKDLADRVLRSTKEIGGLIRAVQSESGNAAEAIKRGSESVRRGVDLAAEAGVSLEEITAAASASRERIRGIVAAVQDQARAAGHVVGLMESVNQRVEAMRRAGAEQERGNEVIMRGSLMMRDVAQQTHRTTEEQARGARQMRQSIEGIQEAVDQIHRSLEGQAGASRSAVASLQRVHEKTASNREATDQMSQATEGLRQQAQTLRDDVGRFRVA